MEIEPRWRFRASPKRNGRTVVAVLPNGRVVWMRLAPALASASSTDEVLRRVDRTSHRIDARLDAHATRLDRLRRRVGDDVARLARARTERSRQLGRRLAASNARLDRALTAQTIATRAAVEKQDARLGELARRLARRDLWDKITIATSLPLFAAYGDSERPFSADNLTLTLSLLVWLAGDELAQSLFGGKNDEPDALRDPDVWSFLAPVGNVLTGWWLMHNRQHERFVSDITSLTSSGGTATTAVRSLVAPLGATARPAIRTAAAVHAPPDAETASVAATFETAPSARARKKARAGAARALETAAEASTKADAPLGDLPSPDASTDTPYATVPPVAASASFEAIVDLTPYIALDYQEDFESFEGVAAVAAVTRFTLAPDVPAGAVKVGNLTATVDGLALVLTVTVSAVADTNLDPARLTSAITALEVAWIVDTKRPRNERTR